VLPSALRTLLSLCFVQATQQWLLAARASSWRGQHVCLSNRPHANRVSHTLLLCLIMC